MGYRSIVFLVTLVVAVGTSFLAWNLCSERVPARLRQLGVRVHRDWQGKIIAVRLDGLAVRDEDLRLLTTLDRVHTLRLSGTTITDTGLVHVRQLPHLTGLDLSDTLVGDAGVCEIRDMRKLRFLVLLSRYADQVEFFGSILCESSSVTSTLSVVQ